MSAIAKPATRPAASRALEGRVEYRIKRLDSLELREPDATGDGQYTLIGHAAVFEQLSLPLYDWWFGEFRETIAPGAFGPVLARNPDVHLVYVHDMASAMARTQSKTLELSQDPRGLRVYARLDPDDPDVQRIAPKMRRGDVDQMSFAFTVANDEWLIENEGSEDQVVTRTVLEIGELFDVSVVPQGAFPQTDSSLRDRELRTLIRAAARAGSIARPKPELRADVPAISLLTDMFELGQEFIEIEDDPDDEPDHAVMQEVLDRLEQLIETEAQEDEASETNDEEVARPKAGARRKRRAGGGPAGAATVAPEEPAGGVVDARERRAAEMRQQVELVRLPTPAKEF